MKNYAKFAMVQVTKGRLGLYEVMRINENIRSLIMKSANAVNIKECAINHGMRPLLNYGLELVNEGLTTLEEVERVCLFRGFRK